MDRKIILASKSPRRQVLLRLGGIAFEVVASCAEEMITKKIPEEVVEELSHQKAKTVYEALSEKSNAVIIGADTIVSYSDEILGKPQDKADARRMLRLLSGQVHEVYTGVTVMWNNMRGEMLEKTFSECTKVKFYPLDDSEIESYIESGDPMDKAGAYGIQSGAAKFVEKIDGDYNNVVGLPLARLYHELKSSELI